METSGIVDLAVGDAPGQVVDPVREGVPDAAVFFGGRVAWWFDRMTFDDERVEVDHGDVVVKQVEDGGASDACG